MAKSQTTYCIVVNTTIWKFNIIGSDNVDDRYWMRSIERANLVVNLIANEPGKHRLIDISKSLNINKSSIFSMLSTLEFLGWVIKEKGNTYILGPTLGAYATAYSRNFNILESFNMEAEKTLKKLDENILLGVLNGTNVLCLGAQEKNSIVRIATDVGMQFPAHATSFGKIQLIQYSYNELMELYNDKKIEQKTPNTIKTIDELWKQLESARIAGYIIDDQEYLQGCFSIAAPVYNHKNVLICGVSCTMLENSWNEKKEQATHEIVDLAKRLSELAGYTQP